MKAEKGDVRAGEGVAKRRIRHNSIDTLVQKF